MTKWQIFIGTTLLLGTFVTDRIVKIETTLGFRANYGFVRWTQLHNYGAAAGILSGHRVFLIVVGIIVMMFLSILPRVLRVRSVVFAIGWGFAMGGALGNLWDRVVHGYVIDMFQIRGQDGVFNVADVGIHLGLILMVVTYFVVEISRDRQKKRRQGVETGS